MRSLLFTAATPLLLRSSTTFASIRHTRSITRPSFVQPPSILISSTHNQRIMSTQPFKRAKPDALASTKVIGTHSGSFQADEALGVWLLRQTPTYRNSTVIRSRDPVVLQTCDIVIDVGGVYDHETLKYDHHQRGYEEKFEPKVGKNGISAERCTKLSASGLVYRHYGKEVIREYYPGLSQELLDLVSRSFYYRFCDIYMFLLLVYKKLVVRIRHLTTNNFCSFGISQIIIRPTPKCMILLWSQSML